MMVVLVVAGVGFMLAGLLAIGFGIPVKEFSFGNTLILAGATMACTGAILLGFWVVVRELKNVARQLGGRIGAGSTRSPAGLGAVLSDQVTEEGGFLFSRDQPTSENAEHAEPAAPPWHEEVASRDRGRNENAASEPVDAAPGAKPRRNLLFSSTSRKERERAQARTETSAVDRAASASPRAASAAPPAVLESVEPPPVTFDDAWPKSERARAADAPLPRRGGRAPSTFAEAGAGATDRHLPAPRNEDQPPVTVLKSGVVDGMAYSLYSDGSIEAQLPEGMMRFASIDELRTHLDQRT